MVESCMVYLYIYIYMFITYFQVRPTKMQWLGMAWDGLGWLGMLIALEPWSTKPLWRIADFPCVPHNLYPLVN